MDHIKDSDMIEYVGGRLSASQNEQLREHIAACSACNDRWEETTRIWEMLSEWTVDTAGHDVTGRIEAPSAKTRYHKYPSRPVSILRSRYVFMATRLAASIIIAVVIGNVLGRWSVSREVSTEKTPEYLSVLGLKWSSGFLHSVLEENVSSNGNNNGT